MFALRIFFGVREGLATVRVTGRFFRLGPGPPGRTRASWFVGFLRSTRRSPVRVGGAKSKERTPARKVTNTTAQKAAGE